MTKMPGLRGATLVVLLGAALMTLVAGSWLWATTSVIGLQAVGDWLSAPMKAITFLGDEYFYLVIIPLVFWSIDKELGAELGILLAASNILNGAVKSFFKHPRPFWERAALKAVEESSFSLPSAHSQNSAALLGRLALEAPRRLLLRTGWRLLLVALIVLVPVSRVYLGVHFPGDVIWGAALGLALLSVYTWLKPRLKPWLNAQPINLHVILAGASAAAVLIINLALLSAQIGAGAGLGSMLYEDAVTRTMEDAATVAGMVFGIWAGLAYESKYVRFSVAGPLRQRTLRFVIGIAGLLLIWMGLKMVFPAEPLGLGLALRTLRYALAVLWVLVGWPWLFVKLGLGKGEAHLHPPIKPAT